MPAEIGDRQTLIENYLQRVENDLKRRMAAFSDKREFYALQGEPISSLFADHVTVTVDDVVDAYDPFEAKVISHASIVWNEQAKKVLTRMGELGIDPLAHARSGGVYQTTIANKRIRKWNSQRRELIYDAMELYRRPWWTADQGGRFMLDLLLAEYQQKTSENINVLRHNPGIVLVGKPPNTGTGWSFPIDTRLGLSQHLPSYAEQCAGVCEQYYTDLRELLREWPDRGGVVHIGGQYRGITGGARSDVDVTEWSTDNQRFESMTREVGNDPSSAFHNKSLNPTLWQMDLWRRFKTEYHYLPNDPEGYIAALLTPPATRRGSDPHEMVIVSADFGYAQRPSRYNANLQALEIVNEGRSFGADNISMSGIFLRPSGSGKLIPMIKSGTPYTMTHYLIMGGHAVGAWARANGIGPQSLRILQVGDDLQIILERRFVEPLMAALGPWLRVKGMQTYAGKSSYFMLGHNVVWHEDGTITIFTTPRAIKSVTSAVLLQRGDVPETIKVGDTFELTVNEDAKAQSQELWSKYPKLIFFHGCRDDYEQWMREDFMRAKLEAAKLGVSEWFLDYEDESIADSEGRSMQGHTFTTPEPVISTAEETAPDTPVQLPPTPEEPGVPQGAEVPQPVEDAVLDTASTEGKPKASTLIYGFPTTGKTTTKKWLEDNGYTVLDQDELSAKVEAEFGMEKPWRQPDSPEYAKFQARLDELFAEADGQYDYILCNSWRALEKLNRKARFAFVRTSAQRVHELSAARDGGEGIPVEIAERWLADIDKIRAAVGDLTILGDEEYMLPYVQRALKPVGTQ